MINLNLKFFFFTAFVIINTSLPAVAQAYPLLYDLNGDDITLDWSAMQEASTYTLYYAFTDYKGDIDINSIGSIEMQSKKTIYVSDLPSGLTIFAAILAHTSNGDVLSNIIRFMGFDGTISMPETGSVFMQAVSSNGDRFSIEGTRSGDADFTITSISGIQDGKQFKFSIENDQITSYRQDDFFVMFFYNTDGSFARLVFGDELAKSFNKIAGATTSTCSDDDAWNAIMADPDSNQEYLTKAEPIRQMYHALHVVITQAITILDDKFMSLSYPDSYTYNRLRDKAVLLTGFRSSLMSCMTIELDILKEHMIEDYKDRNCSGDTNDSDESEIIINTACHIPEGAKPHQDTYSNGTVEYYTLNGINVGPYKYWREGSDHEMYLDRESCNDAEGSLNGWAIAYYQNGNMKIATHYKKGVIDGHEYRFDEDGTLYSDKTFVNGTAVYAESYCKDGALESYWDASDGIAHIMGCQ
jgi:hypothetical protein